MTSVCRADFPVWKYLIRAVITFTVSLYRHLIVFYRSESNRLYDKHLQLFLSLTCWLFTESTKCWVHLTPHLWTSTKQRVGTGKTTNYSCLTNLLCVTQQFTKLLLFTVRRHSCSLLSAYNLANANQCFDSLTFHLTVHVGLRSSAKYVLPDMNSLVWCLAISPNPPTRVPSRSRPLFLCVCFSLTVSLVVRLGSTFHLDWAFGFNVPIFAF